MLNCLKLPLFHKVCGSSMKRQGNRCGHCGTEYSYVHYTLLKQRLQNVYYYN